MKNKKGRPLDTPLVRDHVLGIRLNDQELKALSTYCWRYDKSYSEVIRDSLQLLSVIPDWHQLAVKSRKTNGIRNRFVEWH